MQRTWASIKELRHPDEFNHQATAVATSLEQDAFLTVAPGRSFGSGFGYRGTS
jgi:hypothetical protein